MKLTGRCCAFSTSLLLAVSACFVEPGQDPSDASDPDGAPGTTAASDGAGDDAEDGPAGQTGLATGETGSTSRGQSDDDGDSTTTRADDPTDPDQDSSDSQGTGEPPQVVLFDFFEVFCGPEIQRSATESGNTTVMLCGLGGTPLPYLDTQAAITTPTGESARAIVMDFPALAVSALFSMTGLLPLLGANDPRFVAEFECAQGETGQYQYTVMLRHADYSTSDPSAGIHICGDPPTLFDKPLPTDEDVGIAISILTNDEMMRRIVIADAVVVDVQE